MAGMEKETTQKIGYFTEEQAREKWCFAARYYSRFGEAINRWQSKGESQLNPVPARCIASDCMAGWRWGENGWQLPDGTIVNPMAIDGPLPEGAKKVNRGYCALGGKPEFD